MGTTMSKATILKASAFLFILAGCESKDQSATEKASTTESVAAADKNVSAKKTAEAKPKADTQAQKADAKPKAAEAELSHDELLKQGATLEGKEVTVKAVSWGTVGIKDGGKRLNLGPAKLEGLRQAHLVADFKPDDKSVEAIEKDAEVKLQCTVGKKAYGARQLEGCKIL